MKLLFRFLKGLGMLLLVLFVVATLLRDPEGAGDTVRSAGPAAGNILEGVLSVIKDLLDRF